MSPVKLVLHFNDIRILGMVKRDKRDTITDIKDSVGNILGVNKEESLLDYIEDEIDTQLDVDVSRYFNRCFLRTMHCTLKHPGQ